MSNKRIAYWMSEKKLQKLNWYEFEKACEKYGFSIFRLDLYQNFDSQKPFCVFLHKLTDIIISAEEGDAESIKIIKKVENYVAKNPSLIVVDPIPNVRLLLNRYKCYSIINSTNLHDYDIFTPKFCELNSSNTRGMIRQLKAAGVQYPFICKPYYGHGKKAHEMSIIFNERGLVDCKSPSVAQNFINHNAVLYKIFIAGDKFHFEERPSLKNFYAGNNATIHFTTADVSKIGSQSSLSVLDPKDEEILGRGPDMRVLERIAHTLRQAFDMDLLGVDVVIENFSGKYGIIDVNAYPGYDGFPNFFEVLLECIDQKLSRQLLNTETGPSCYLKHL